MNKLLGLLVLGLAFALTLGTVGCTTKKDEDKDKKDKVADKKDKDNAETKDKKDKVADKKDKDKKGDAETTDTVEFKKIDGPVEGKKSGETKVTLELEKAAPVDLTMKASVKDVKSEIFAGAGVIKKGDTKGELVITTKDAPAGKHTVDVMVTGEKAKGKGTFTFEVK